MKLKYNILCIDDDINRLRDIKEEFADYNANVGLEVVFEDVDASIKARENVEDFKLRITNQISQIFSKKSFDLILVDLHFGPKVGEEETFNGSHIIELIREDHNLYRPIIFYSAGDPQSHEEAVKQLNSAAESSGIFGKSIFTKPYDELSSFLLEVANEMHTEEHKVNQVRGLLMDGVSEIDAKIILTMKKKALWDNIPTDKQEKITDLVKKRIRRKAKTSLALCQEIKTMDFEGIKDFFQNGAPYSTDMNTKSEILRETLKTISSLKNQGDILSQFYNGSDCLASTRNNYAHKVAEELNTDHTLEKCKFIREETRRQMQNIEKILKS